MGGRDLSCPFCGKWCLGGGVKDHIKSKHPDRYQEWIKDGMKPAWMYNIKGEK